MPACTLPRPLSSPAPLAALLLLLSACPPDDGAPGGASAQPDESAASTGNSGATDPTTGDDDDVSTGEPAGGSTSGPVTSDSDILPGTVGDPTPPACPYDLPGVDVALDRSAQGAHTDLGARPCGDSSSAHLVVTAAGATHLALSACSSATCGDCDPADSLALDLTIPAAFPGLPPELAPGVCLRLDLAWNKPADDPATCRVSALALVRMEAGQAEPVPRFLYHHSGSLPASDPVGPFTLTGDPAAPGEVTCPCDGDCCELQPGSLPVRFTAGLAGKGEVGLFPLEPGSSVPAFEIEPIEGDTLAASVHLVRSTVPSACDAPAQHEWLLRLVALP